MPRKKWVAPEPKTEEQAKVCIARGYSWYYVHKKVSWMLKKAPVYVASIIALLGLFKNVTTDAVDLQPISEVRTELSLMPKAYAGDIGKVDTNWTALVVRRGEEYWLRIIYKPTNRGMETPAPWVEKIKSMK